MDEVLVGQKVRYAPHYLRTVRPWGSPALAERVGVVLAVKGRVATVRWDTGEPERIGAGNLVEAAREEASA